MATQKDVSRRAGVTIPTVSKILNGLTAPFSKATIRRVRRAARQAGYSLRKLQRSRTERLIAGLPRALAALEKKASFSVRDVAWIFRMSVQGIHHWIEVGKVRDYDRTSRRGNYRVPRSEVVRLLKLERREVPGLWRPRRRKLLLIDDYEPIRKMVSDAFRDPKFALDVRTAASIEDGLLLAAVFRPDVILVDDCAPTDRLSSDQALAFIRRANLTRRTRVIVVSADPEVGKRMIQAGADQFLQKPYSLGDLRAVVLGRGRGRTKEKNRSECLRALVRDPTPSH